MSILSLRRARTGPLARRLVWSLLLSLSAPRAAPAAEVEFELPMRFPRLDHLSVTLPAPGGTAIPVELDLGYDDRGKVVCAGTCSADGVAASVKGKVKDRKGTLAYTLAVRGLAEKLAVKLAGELAPGAAAPSFKYAGARGKAKGEASAFDLAAAGVRSLVDLMVEVDARGKISGTGSILPGFASAPLEGPIKGKLKGDRLTLALKAGRRKIVFKGVRSGEVFTGTLKFSLPPEKGTRSGFSIPDFTLPPPGPGETGPLVVDPVTSPTRESSARITGKGPAGAAIEITGGAEIARATAGSDGAFSAAVRLIHDRVNRLYVVATPPGGEPSAPVTADVIQDSEPPRVFIDEPAAGVEVTEDRIVVAGRVSDTLSGFLGLEVMVNGVPANVVEGLGTNGTFERSGVELEPGSNRIDVIARDSVGNESFASAIIRRVEVPPSAPRLAIVSGNGQVGRARTILRQPLAVRVTQPDGTPIAGKLVTFQITRSDGRLSPSRFASPEEEVTRFGARTDGDGIAQVAWRLGSDAGCGNNRVEASSAGIAGVARFCASATPGPASRILVGTGNDQRVETGGQAPERLVAWVNDACNGIGGVEVEFRALDGGLVDGASTATVTTSLTGHAAVTYVAGSTSGPQRIEATFAGNRGPPAAFTVLALERGTAGETRFEGVVLDNASTPIGGAPCFLIFPGRTPLVTRSAADGRFAFDQVPHSGPATLQVEGLEATDLGGTAIPPGSFPSLGYQVVVVAGAVNALPGPVLLPALDPVNARTYDGTSDVELTCAGIEGLVMRIRAGSMRRADGSVPTPENPAVVSLDQVQIDRIPMPMPNGAGPPFAWTLQPGGATFDPPVEVEIPNMAGLPAGSVAYILSFNHDTHRFDIVATGHVGAGGALVRSDPGAGIAVAGWGGLCPPYPITGDVEYQNCISIDAEKVAGGALASGSYLCLNQGERIRMRAVRDASCDEGEVEWSVHPSSAGSFEGSPVGDEVIFVQADGYVSSSVNDVEIRARSGGAEARFKLTVFHVESDSGLLFRNTVREFRSVIFPSAANANRVAGFMNQFIFNIGFDTREYATGAAAISKPLVSGVIEDAEFFVRNGDLWVRVTSGDTPGDVNITLEADGELLHREHMTVLDVDLEIVEAWSDQFPGIKANLLPGQTGAKNYPYVLMGQRADQQAYVKARVIAGDIPPELEDRIEVRLALVPFGTGIPEPVGASVIEKNGNEWTVSMRHGSYEVDAATAPVKYRVIAGIDLDEDGDLETEEIGVVFGEHLDYHFKVVTKGYYQGNQDFFLTGAAVATAIYPVASTLLKAFGAGQTPEGVTTTQQSIGLTSLDHNVGALFTADGTASIDRYVFPPDSLASSKVLASTEFRSKLSLILASHRNEVLQFFAENDTGGLSHEFEWELIHGADRTVAFGAEQDLFRAFGTASLFGTIKVLVDDPPNHEVLSVEVNGFLYDLYDWDFSGGGFLDDRAASVQAGFGTLGFGGGVFSSEVRLEKTLFNVNFEFQPGAGGQDE